MKKRRIVLIIIGILIVLGLILSFFLYQQRVEQERLEKEEKERKETIKRIKLHYDLTVIVDKESALYKKKKDRFEKAGMIAKGRKLRLEKTKITEKTKYFKIDGLDYYISYKQVSPTKESIIEDTRYQNYIVFNENVLTKEEVHLYKNNELAYFLTDSLDLPIIEKGDEGVFVSFYDNLYLIKNEDIVKTYEKQNTDSVSATAVPVTVYHFIYPETDDCNEDICNPTSEVREHFTYLKDEGYFTLTTKEMRLFLEEKIRLPQKSILITIDDGARAENVLPILEEFKVNATLFLVSSWYPTEKFASNYLEIASHTHDLHTPRVCPGGQGSPLKCLDEDKLLGDLKASRDTLNQTEAFCFPFYEFNDYAIEMVKKAGFKIAFIGGMRKAKLGTNLYKVPRITLTKRTTLDEYKEIVRVVE